MTAATKKPPTDQGYGTSEPMCPPLAIGAAPVSLREIIYQRRSAIALDGRTSITREAFYRFLAKTVPGPGQFPFNTLPWTPLIHLALFVHRVQDLDSGLYVLVRDPAQTPTLRAEMKPDLPGGNRLPVRMGWNSIASRRATCVSYPSRFPVISRLRLTAASVSA